jgi:hypothetical protein
MSITNYAELALLNTLRNVSFTVTGTWLKLHTGDPGEDASANAAVNTSRQSVSFSAAASGSMASSATVSWTNVSTTETYTHWSLWDSVGPTGGNPLWKGALSTSASVTAGDTFQITSLTLSLD